MEILRGRMSIVGPTTAEPLAESVGVAREEVDAAFLALESEGVDSARARLRLARVPSSGAIDGCSHEFTATR